MNAQNIDSALGIEWHTEPVSKRAGANDSDKIEWREDAQIPHVVDLDAARKGFGEAAVLAGLNGTSWRVAAQDVARRNDRRLPVADLRAAVVARLKGIRSATTARVREVVKVPAMDGSEPYTLTGNAAADLAGLMDKGWSQEMARTMLKI